MTARNRKAFKRGQASRRKGERRARRHHGGDYRECRAVRSIQRWIADDAVCEVELGGYCEPCMDCRAASGFGLVRRTWVNAPMQ